MKDNFLDKKMRDLNKVGELSGEDLNQSKIMSTIAGGDK